MSELQKIKAHYNLELSERLNNLTESGIYSQKLKDLDLENSKLGFGCLNLFEFFDLKSLFAKRILDIGCGVGSDLFYLKKLTSPSILHGLDISDAMVDLANSRLKPIGGEVFLSDILSFSAKSRYDFIFSNAVLHLNPNLEPIFSKVFTLLKEDGEFLLADFMVEEPLEPSLVEEFINSKGNFLFGGLKSRSEYLSGLAQAGFEEVEILATRRFDPSKQLQAILKPELLAKVKETRFLILVIKASVTLPYTNVSFNCPACQHLRKIKHYSGLNRQINHNLFKHLKEDFFLACENCGRLEIEAPMQYHDMDNKQMLVVFPKENLNHKEEFENSLLFNMRSKMPHYQIDLCFGIDEFFESILD